jgi:hypothetical protein
VQEQQRVSAVMSARAPLFVNGKAKGRGAAQRADDAPQRWGECMHEAAVVRALGFVPVPSTLKRKRGEEGEGEGEGEATAAARAPPGPASRTCFVCLEDVGESGGAGRCVGACQRAFHKRCPPAVRSGLDAADSFECLACVETSRTGAPADTANSVVEQSVDDEEEDDPEGTWMDSEKELGEIMRDSGPEPAVAVVSKAAAAREARPPPYHKLNRSKWLIPRVKLPRRELLGRCDCDASSGCGLGCVNRAQYEECTDETCALQDDPKGRCKNRPMQRGAREKVNVAVAPGKGHGLFAAGPIAKGDFIIEYVGEVIDGKMCLKRFADWKELGISSFYVMELSEDVNIDAGTCGNEARFANHCCSPNAAPFPVRCKDERRIALFADKNIATGEEITFDYMWLNFAEKPWECKCKAENCRKYLGANAKKAGSNFLAEILGGRSATRTLLDSQVLYQYGERSAVHLLGVKPPVVSNDDIHELSRRRIARRESKSEDDIRPSRTAAIKSKSQENRSRSVYFSTYPSPCRRTLSWPHVSWTDTADAVRCSPRLGCFQRHH